jgi:hypothetical protein
LDVEMALFRLPFREPDVFHARHPWLTRKPPITGPVQLGQGSVNDHCQVKACFIGCLKRQRVVGELKSAVLQRHPCLNHPLN